MISGVFCFYENLKFTVFPDIKGSNSRPFLNFKIGLSKRCNYLINGERAEVSTNRKVEISKWDSDTQRAKGRSESARILNYQRIEKISKFYSIKHWY